jgi:ABC-2 type transport system ATP-binding protein
VTAGLARHSPDMPLAIEANRLAKSYGALEAVGEVSLQVRSGEFFGLLGPNGAGKTTTIHMLATLLRPSRGTATVAGYDVVSSPLAVRRNIGIVFQETTLDLDLTAGENLHFAGALYGIELSERRRRIEELLDLFELTARTNDRVRVFSGGMRRALDLARGVLHRPRILFLDEPTLGLDPVHRRAVWRFLQRLRDEQSMTLFLTTHYLAEADDCDRVAFIQGGHIAAHGSPADLKRKFAQDSIEIQAHEVDDALLAEVRRRTGREPRRGEGGIIVSVPAAEEVLPQLLPLIGDRVRSVGIRRASLEDVFVAVAGRPDPVLPA